MGLRLLAILGSIACLSLHAQTPPAKPPANDSPFAGSNGCRPCHPAQALQFYRNPHFKTTVAEGATSENSGCESCHGAGKKHIAAAGGRVTIPNAFSLMQPNQVLDACLRCHSKDVNRANIRRSSHTQANVVCTSCHSIHRSDSAKSLLAAKQADVCYGCHSDVRAQFSQPFKHRVNEGFMTCSDCHNPHGANSAVSKTGHRPRMIETGLQNEQPCMKCHTDKRGPFLFEHAAVRVDGCESCHSPHGSTNARLLKRPVVFTVCLECHNGAGSFGRQADGIPTQSASHNMADPRYRNCTTCHVRIHGSNADRRFLR